MSAPHTGGEVTAVGPLCCLQPFCTHTERCVYMTSHI